jgi:FkbM family methyltransferase
MLKSIMDLKDLDLPLYPPIGVLDYPGHELAMEAMTDFTRDSGKPLPPEKAYRLNACRKEPWTVAWIERIASDGVLYDIGANVGSYTLVAASRGLAVVAIEAARTNLDALVRNVWRNDLAVHVIAQQIVLGDRNGLTWVNYGDMRSGAANHQIGDPRNPNLQREIVPMLRLDALIEMHHLPKCTHVKIDVDGGEAAVLVGMEQTLQHPAMVSIMLEMQLENEAALLAWLGERGWEMVERYNQRDGHTIGQIAYAEFRRVAAPPTATKGVQEITATASLNGPF